MPLFGRMDTTTGPSCSKQVGAPHLRLPAPGCRRRLPCRGVRGGLNWDSLATSVAVAILMLCVPLPCVPVYQRVPP